MGSTMLQCPTHVSTISHMAWLCASHISAAYGHAMCLGGRKVKMNFTHEELEYLLGCVEYELLEGGGPPFADPDHEKMYNTITDKLRRYLRSR